MRAALRWRSISTIAEDSSIRPAVEEEPEEEWPPADARLRSALWRAEGHIERGEYAAAAKALSDAFGLGEHELVHGLHHLAAAGYRAQTGEPERARRQLAHARRRLGPFLPERAEVAVAALLELVERDLGS
jgi:hypothetical protein